MILSLPLTFKNPTTAPSWPSIVIPALVTFNASYSPADKMIVSPAAAASIAFWAVWGVAIVPPLVIVTFSATLLAGTVIATFAPYIAVAAAVGVAIYALYKQWNR